MEYQQQQQKKWWKIHQINIPKEVKKLRGNENVITNIYIIQACNWIMGGQFCSGFINFMLKGKSSLDYTTLFSPNDYQKNDKII